MRVGERGLGCAERGVGGCGGGRRRRGRRRGRVARLLVVVSEQPGELRHRVGDEVRALDRQPAAQVGGGRDGDALHAGREEVDVLQRGEHAARAQDGERVLVRELLERLQRLLGEVDVLDREQPLAEERHRVVVHERGGRRRQHVHHVAHRARRQQHDVRVVPLLEHLDEYRHEDVDRHRGERVLGADGEQLAQLGERGELLALVVRFEAGEDGLQAAVRRRRAGEQQVVEAGAQLAQQAVQRARRRRPRARVRGGLLEAIERLLLRLVGRGGAALGVGGADARAAARGAGRGVGGGGGGRGACVRRCRRGLHPAKEGRARASARGVAGGAGWGRVGGGGVDAWRSGRARRGGPASARARAAGERGVKGGKREVASAPIRHVCLFARLLSGGRRGAVSRSAGAHARARRDWVRRVQRAAAAARNVPGDEATACAGRAQGRQAGAALAQRAATVPRAAYLLSGAGGSTGSRPTARLLRVRALRAVGRIAVREPAGPGACHEEVWRQRMQPRRPPPRALPGLRSGAVRRVRATRGVVGGGVRPARGGSGPLGGASAPRQDVWRVSSSRLHASPGGATRGQARQGYEQSACQHAARRCAMTGRAARWGGGGGRGAGGRLWTEFLGANLEKEWLLPPPDLMSEPRRRRLAVVDCLFGKF